jgi:hypothetical protein
MRSLKTFTNEMGSVMKDPKFRLSILKFEDGTLLVVDNIQRDSNNSLIKCIVVEKKWVLHKSGNDFLITSNTNGVTSHVRWVGNMHEIRVPEGVVRRIRRDNSEGIIQWFLRKEKRDGN